jgi:hypothetical protein
VQTLRLNEVIAEHARPADRAAGIVPPRRESPRGMDLPVA